MKTTQHPLFLMAALCLFFPIGLNLLLLSDQPAKRKFFMSISGGFVFLALLATAFIGIPKAIAPGKLDLVVTNTQLTVGQSGGFSLYSSNRIVTDFTVITDNNKLQINDNVYTGLEIGSTEVSVQAEGFEESFTVMIVDGTATDSIVYLSPTGERYHSSQKHAGNNGVEMTEEEALRSGKTPCLICHK